MLASLLLSVRKAMRQEPAAFPVVANAYGNARDRGNSRSVSPIPRPLLPRARIVQRPATSSPSVRRASIFWRCGIALGPAMSAPITPVPDPSPVRSTARTAPC